MVVTLARFCQCEQAIFITRQIPYAPLLVSYVDTDKRKDRVVFDVS